jgi:hypothetical protein
VDCLRNIRDVGFEVLTAVTMKNAAFWDVAPCRSCEMLLPAHAGCSSLADFSTLKMEALHSSETSVHFTEFTRHHIPEYDILQISEMFQHCNSKISSVFVLAMLLQRYFSFHLFLSRISQSITSNGFFIQKMYPFPSLAVTLSEDYN